MVASDRDQAALLIDAAAGLIDGTPALAAVLSVNAYKITAQSGATVEVIPADGASAFGLRPSLVVVDEFAQWPETRNARRVWLALISSVGKVPGCRLVVLTSAGEPSHWSYKIIDAARKSADWRVNEVEGPLPWLDPAQLKALEAQRPLLRDSEYARLHLNIWTQAEDRLVSATDLEAAAVLDGPLEPQPGVRYVVTLDVGLTNDACVAVVAHAEQRGDDKAEARRLVVDRIARWHGTKAKPVSLDEVEAWVATSSETYNRAPVHADPWQAAGVLQRLAKRGVIAEQFVFSSTSVGRVAQALHLALRNRLIWLPKDDDLLSELSRVRLRETSPGVVRLDHDSGQHDDQAVAIGIAVAVLLGSEMSSAAKDWIESMAPKTEAANDNREVGWRWTPIPEPAFAPETAATLAMLRSLNPDSI